MSIRSSLGVCFQEVVTRARPIGAVGTSIAGFVGVAPDPGARAGEAVAVNSWSQFLRVFGGVEGDRSGTALSRAVCGFFDNGGGRCFVVNIAPGEPIVGESGRQRGLDLLARVEEVSIVAAPGYTDVRSHEALLAHCELLGDRVAILDPPPHVDYVEHFTELPSPTVERADEVRPDGAAVPAQGRRFRDSEYGVLYVPWIVVRDPLLGKDVATAPSGHLAGVWARVDTLRGVHRSSHNERVCGVVELRQSLSEVDQKLLNAHGVNCLGYDPSVQVRVIGAHTLAAQTSDWRCLSARRLVNMIRQSIVDRTKWIVGEPDDCRVWRELRHDINTFLTQVWRDGALVGRTPGEAFFVKCDEETNPVEVREAKKVVMLVGVAPQKPANFVVLRLSQSILTADIEPIEA